MVLILLYWIHVDTQWQVRVLYTSIIINWGLGDMYHPTSLHLTIDCINLLNRQDSTGLGGVICRSIKEYVPWRSPLPFSLIMTIGSVVLIYSIYIGETLDFAISSISYNFWPLDIWVAVRPAWWYNSLSCRERGIMCVFLKCSWVIVEDDSFKYSHVSTRTSFMWSGENLRFSW